ncbi:UvrB/UvrC motif-containing protein [Crateriforma conspicua]|uniref:UvrB/uvrC motif protein n=1 Tax=Crateriforma conspicua TaxID=2527996 RepID=A0A5C5Y886_9PLAN|nr:UvrB/UvrC motif-containing protein [Crateriforma conspicua]QDV65296.1 UvrB/uvrC motif protein [Crateriforma conspicua]TWT70691.1 UvrB/uvrC motif protein [Crateriforma conspicua]
MKCHYCEKPATFHITELTGDDGPQVMHLCELHAKQFLQKESASPTASLAGVIAKQLHLGQTKEEIEQLDQKECPVCGISFFEFRNSGRLGCPYDYVHFEADLKPLLINIHDATEHTGKRPRRAAATADAQAEMIQLRRDMEEAVEREDYELASQIRDRLKEMEPAVIEDPGDASGPAAENQEDAGDEPTENSTQGPS